MFLEHWELKQVLVQSTYVLYILDQLSVSISNARYWIRSVLLHDRTWHETGLNDGKTWSGAETKPLGHSTQLRKNSYPAGSNICVKVCAQITHKGIFNFTKLCTGLFISAKRLTLPKSQVLFFTHTLLCSPLMEYDLLKRAARRHVVHNLGLTLARWEHFRAL